MERTGEGTHSDSAWFGQEVMVLLPDLYGGARSLCEGPDEAEDLVAEAVARAWEHRNELRERSRFRGWLFRILRNCCLGRKRRQKSRPDRVPLPDDGDAAPSFSLFERLHQPFLLWWDNPEEEFLNGLLKEDLARAVSQLPEAYRNVVTLADVHEFTYAEIAETLEIPVGTVRSRLARGRSLLQKNLWTHAVDAGLREPSTEPEETTVEPER